VAHRTGFVTRRRWVLAAVWLLAASAYAQALPQVLIVGDSISIGYTPIVKELLSGKAEVDRVVGNAADTRNTLAHLDDWLARGTYQVITLNCGLHDLKFNEANKTFQVPLEEYKKNLPRIVERLRSSGARVVWVTTTPVDDLRHAKRLAGFSRYQRDVEEYNAAATPIMKKLGVPVCDLYKVVRKAGEDNLLGKDGVHYTDQGYRLLGGKVAAAVERELKRVK
jgi:lysophospholipase L1-like esterase